MTKQQQVYDLWKEFIESRKITCAEAIYQMDDIIDQAEDMFEQTADIIGYAVDNTIPEELCIICDEIANRCDCDTYKPCPYHKHSSVFCNCQNEDGSFTLQAWTDYPFIELGDTPNQKAPVRRIRVLSYDGDKYCKIDVEGKYLTEQKYTTIIKEQLLTEIKSGYIYQSPGRYGEVPGITKEQINLLKVVPYVDQYKY